MGHMTYNKGSQDNIKSLVWYLWTDHFKYYKRFKKKVTAILDWKQQGNVTLKMKISQTEVSYGEKKPLQSGAEGRGKVRFVDFHFMDEILVQI